MVCADAVFQEPNLDPGGSKVSSGIQANLKSTSTQFSCSGGACTCSSEQRGQGSGSSKVTPAASTFLQTEQSGPRVRLGGQGSESGGSADLFAPGLMRDAPAGRFFNDGAGLCLGSDSEETSTEVAKVKAAEAPGDRLTYDPQVCYYTSASSVEKQRCRMR